MQLARVLVSAVVPVIVVAAAAGCGASEGSSEPEPTAAPLQGIALPAGATSDGSGAEHCDAHALDRAEEPVDVAFLATVRSTEPLDDGSNWVTFDVERWFTEDLGDEAAFFVDDDGPTEPGGRWLVQASRRDLGGLTSGDVFVCDTKPFSATGFAAWELRFGDR